MNHPKPMFQLSGVHHMGIKGFVQLRHGALPGPALLGLFSGFKAWGI